MMNERSMDDAVAVCDAETLRGLVHEDNGTGTAGEQSCNAVHHQRTNLLVLIGRPEDVEHFGDEVQAFVGLQECHGLTSMGCES
jgi:hypothetical protein